MPLMTWNTAWNVDIEPIDDQHRHLMALINKLYDAVVEKQTSEVLAQIWESLILHTAEHFGYEELLFDSTDFPKAIEHKQEHSQLKEQLLEVHKSFAQASADSILEILNYLTVWLTIHIQEADMQYAKQMAVVVSR